MVHTVGISHEGHGLHNKEVRQYPRLELLLQLRHDIRTEATTQRNQHVTRGCLPLGLYVLKVMSGHHQISYFQIYILRKILCRFYWREQRPIWVLLQATWEQNLKKVFRSEFKNSNNLSPLFESFPARPVWWWSAQGHRLDLLGLSWRSDRCIWESPLCDQWATEFKWQEVLRT